MEDVADEENVENKENVFYTGFPSFAFLKVCFEFLGPAADQLIYWNGKKTGSDMNHRGQTHTPLIEKFLPFGKITTRSSQTRPC